MDEREQRLLRLKQKKRKKFFFVLFLLLLLAGLVGGYFLAVKLREKKETQKADEEEKQLAENKKETFLISDYTFYEVSSIEYTNQEGTFGLYKTVTENGNVWHRTGDDEFPVKNEKILFIIGSFCRMLGTTKIPGAEADLSEYGIKDSNLKVKITLDDGRTQSFRFGNKAPYSEGYYLLDETSGDVFVVDTDIFNEFSTKEIELVEPGDFPTTTKETILKVTVEQEGKEPIEYLPLTGADGTVTYPQIFYDCEKFIATTLQDYRCEDYSIYGLSPAKATLTVEYLEGKLDENGEQSFSDKSIVVEFGDKTESGNTYIRVNHSDFVFIMTSAHVEKYLK